MGLSRYVSFYTVFFVILSWEVVGDLAMSSLDAIFFKVFLSGNIDKLPTIKTRWSDRGLQLSISSSKGNFFSLLSCVTSTPEKRKKLKQTSFQRYRDYRAHAHNHIIRMNVWTHCSLCSIIAASFLREYFCLLRRGLKKGMTSRIEDFKHFSSF